MPRVTVVVTGVRRAAAIVETTSISLTQNADGAQAGSELVTLNDDSVLLVALTLYGEPGASFATKITLGTTGSVEKKGRFKTSVALRGYVIPLEDFE